MKINNERGMLLILLLLIIVVISILSAAFLLMSVNESRVSERQRRTISAFYIAEAGLERALWELREDFLNDPSPSFSDGMINTIDVTPDGPDTANYYVLYGTTIYNSGSYSVAIRNDANNPVRGMYIQSTGTLGDLSETIEVYMQMTNVSIWNNAIFAGVGQSGAVIKGNVDIRGGVHILGSGLADTDIALSMSGTGGIGNNYTGMPAYLRSKIPTLDTTMVDGETVETLYANMRVRQGQVAFSGTGTAGDPNVAGNTTKETLDGVYMNDGYNAAGNQNENNVFSDNGPYTPYDMEMSLDFPSLSDSYQGFASYDDYVRSIAYVVTNAAELAALANITPNSSFSIGSGGNSVTMDGAGNMTVSGVIYVDGNNNLGMAKAGANKTIKYTGTGSFLVKGNIVIDADLITNGDNSYPNNGIGMMTPNDITFSTSSIDVMGLFYAENKIKLEKQTNILGGLVSNYFDMGAQVPSVYQVPSTVNFIPIGMIDNEITWATRVISWRRL